MPLPTPNAIPETTVCRRIYIPADSDIIAAVNGALANLFHPEYWEEIGAVTPDEISAEFWRIWRNFVESDCVDTLNDLSDVAIDTPSENDLLAYDSDGAVWENRSKSEAGFGSIATQNADTVDISGGAIDGTTIGENVSAPVFASNLSVSMTSNMQAVNFTKDSSENAGISTVIRLNRFSPSAFSAGAGVAVIGSMTTSYDPLVNRTFGRIAIVGRDFTDVSRKGAILIQPFDTVSRTAIEAGTDGTQPTLAFYGVTPALPRPTITGSRATGAALVSLLTELAARGVIIDGTTA